MSKEQDILLGSSEKDKYPIPSWATRPPGGSHLDVMKGDQLLQKVMIDEKSAYYFGRNPNLCDIITEHASCSRVHAVLVYHKALKRFSLVDLESCHGTFVSGIRIEPLKPIFLDLNNVFYFGASTRRYTLRPKYISANENHSNELNEEMDLLANLPEKEHELDHLTEYNTAQNRRVPTINISIEEARKKKRPRGSVSFLETEDVINPEDVDPSIGRFRNLVTTAVISKKRKETDAVAEFFESLESDQKRMRIVRPEKDMHEDNGDNRRPISARFSSALGDMSFNLAPDIDLYSKIPEPTSAGLRSKLPAEKEDLEPHKKKYAKEAWPGRKPTSSGLF